MRILALVIWFVASRHENLETDEEFTNEMTATVISASSEYLTVQDRNDVIYTFSDFESDDVLEAGEMLELSYTGDLDKNTEIQTASVLKCAK